MRKCAISWRTELYKPDHNAGSPGVLVHLAPRPPRHCGQEASLLGSWATAASPAAAAGAADIAATTASAAAGVVAYAAAAAAACVAGTAAAAVAAAVVAYAAGTASDVAGTAPPPPRPAAYAALAFDERKHQPRPVPRKRPQNRHCSHGGWVTLPADRHANMDPS